MSTTAMWGLLMWAAGVLLGIGAVEGGWALLWGAFIALIALIYYRLQVERLR